MTAEAAASAHRVPAVPSLIVAGLGLVAVAAVLCACAVTSPLPPRAVSFGSVALACYASGLLCLAGARRGDLGLARWKLGSWMLAWYAVAFGLATLTWTDTQTGTSAQIAVTSVLRALWLVAAGVTAWAAGYAAGPGILLRNAALRRVARLAARRSDVVRGPLTPWLLYGIATCARLVIAVTTGRVGYAGDPASAVSTASAYGQALAALGLLAPLGVCCAALRACRERQPGARLALAVLFLAEVTFGAVSGDKQVFVVAVLAVIIPASAERRRLPKAWVTGAVAVFLVVVIPFTLAYRSAARGSVTLTASQAAREAPGILRQSVTGTAALSAVPASVSYLLRRIRETDSPAVIIQRTPAQIPYASPAQLAEAPVADLVPRVLWPGKPILDSGYQFSQQYYGLPPHLYTSSAVTPVGDLYRHGGWVPVIAGMFLLGCLVRLLDDVLDVRASPHAAFLVLLLFPALVKGEDDWAVTLAGIPVAVAVWLLAVTLAFRPGARPVRSR